MAERSTVLIVTAPDDVHADAVINELNHRSVPVFRLHPQDFPTRVTISMSLTRGRIGGEIRNAHHRVGLSRICSAWYRRPNPVDVAHIDADKRDKARSEASAMLEAVYQAIGARWLCSPAALRIAEIKAIQLARAAALGLATPLTLISNSPDRAHSFRAGVVGSTLVKPLRAEGAFINQIFRFPLANLWTDEVPPQAIAFAPTMFQPYLDKKLELRCVVIGNEVFAAQMVVPGRPQDTIDWRSITFMTLATIPFSLPDAVASQLVELTRSFGIHFASVDMILTSRDEYVFLELNPNGQWLWLDYDAGLPLVNRMANWLSAPTGIGS